jgi:hypothetical protein
MCRVNEESEKKPDPKPHGWNWLKKPWAVVVAVATVVGVFFLNINAVLTNARTFPSEIRKATDQFTSWYYDDDAWTGYWTSEPEAYVDEADMKLSQFPFGLYMKVENGSIDGMIANQEVCSSVPFDFVLLSGHVDTFGNSATVLAWDTLEGHDVYFAKLRLKMDEGIMTVEPIEGTARMFPKARIALDPNVKEWPSEFCTGKQAAEIKMVGRIAKEQQAKQQTSRPASKTPRR